MSLTSDDIIYSSSKVWAGFEEDWLKESFGKVSEEELVRFLNRPLVLIRRKAKALGLLDSARWSDIEVGILARNSQETYVSLREHLFPNRTCLQIAKKLCKIHESAFSRRDFIAELTADLSALIRHATLPLTGPDYAKLCWLSAEIAELTSTEEGE